MSKDAEYDAKNFPADLNKDNKVKTGQDYFTIPVVDLNIGQPYSFNFQWVYPNGKVSPWSDGLTLTTASYTSKLTKPTITVTAASLGYTVAYTKQTDKNFDNAIIEEAVSTSSTAPTSGYQEVGVTSSNPITITVGDVLKRWVRLKLTDKIAGNTAYSDPVAVTPIDPVAASLDSTPPASAGSVVASWSGNNILITATVDADAKKFVIRLTNGSNNGFFTKFPSTAGTSQSILITQSELFNTFGEYYTSFTGLFVSADSFDNRDSGTAFTVATKTNPLLSVVPSFTLTAITNGYTATWTLPTGASYAKVYESGTTWGSGDPSESDLVFSGASPAIIKKTVYTQRFVKIRFLTDDGFTSSWSAEQSVTPIDAIAADVVAPNAPSTISATAGTDSTGTIGFNGVVNISWASVSDTTLRGYRIRFRPYKASAPFENYSYVNSPGTGTTYRLGGLALGTTYEVGIASYDEFNNTSSAYTALSPNIAVSGTPFVGTNVSTTGYFEAGVSGTDTGTFKFGYGVSSGKRGVVLNANNYWYIDSSEAASFKIGGSTNNYVSWNGTKLSVDGDLGVAGGTTIGGNIAMGASGASIYQGTLSSGNLTSDGFLLNSGGLVIKKGSVQLRLDTSDGGIYANYGQIAGWTIDSSKFERGSFTVGGTAGTGTYTGISSSGTYAIWAGSDVSAGNSSANFSVTPAGAVIAKNITITGGSLTVGASSIAASTGKLISTDAEITGKITASTGKIGSINIDSDGLYISDATTPSTTEGNRVIFSGGGIAAYANGSSTPKFQLASNGTGKIAGWTINASSLSAAGMELDSSSQTISFTSGFIIDNDNFTYNVAGSTQASSTYYGSDTDTDGVVQDSFVSSPPGTAVGSSIRIKPSANFNATTSPALIMSKDGTSYSTLQAGGSYISLSSTGVVINTNTTGGIVLKGFASAYHAMYTGTSSTQKGPKEAGAVLQIFSDGRVTAGRAFYRSGSSEAAITNTGGAVWPYVGLIGDVIFSTAD